jgi:hypothetical protein
VRVALLDPDSNALDQRAAEIGESADAVGYGEGMCCSPMTTRIAA